MRLMILMLVSIVLAACGGSPGPLAGTWQLTGPLAMRVQFRSGETEALGIIERVSYEVRGRDVLVTYKDGLMKGSTIRYTMVDDDTARNELGTLRRVR